MRSMWLPLLLLVLCALSSVRALPAYAANGVIELAPVCVMQTGCLPGDASGDPVTISTPGSDRPTGNLEFTEVNSTVVAVTSAGVQLDLNGFAVRCVGRTVRGNDVSNSTSLGLASSVFGTPAAYGGNRFYANNGGNANPQVVGTAIELSPNACGANTSRP